MAMSNEHVSLEESMDIFRKEMTKQIESVEAENNPQMKSDLMLHRALTPAWSRWLKEESDGDTNRIINSVCYAFASIITEVAYNLAKDRSQDGLDKLTTVIAAKLISDIQFNIKHIDDSIPMPGFRRMDS